MPPASAATLSDLPTELLLIVFKQLKAAGILNIGLTCRVLNHIAIPLFLERMGTPYPEKLAVIRPGRVGYADKLTGLTINFALTRIERFVCVLDDHKSESSDQLPSVKSLTRNIKRIYQLFDRLSSVGAVSLVFHSVTDKWTLSSDARGNSLPSFVEFLELLILKSCASIQIVHGHPLHIEQSSNLARTKKSPLRRFSRLLTHRPSEDPIPSLNMLAHSHITGVDFRMDFLLAPPLLAWTLAVMKHSPITSLTLSAIRLERKAEFRDWLLPEIVRLVPGLQDIKLHFEGNEFLPIIIEKLPLYPELQKITLAQAYYINFPPGPTINTSLYFPKLTSITASLEQTVYLFNQNIRCPSLASIGIIHTLGSQIEPFGCSFLNLTDRLSALDLKPTISLCLDHVSGYAKFLELGESGPPPWVTSLHTVSQLTLVQPAFPKSQQLARVLDWLTLFRGVKRLTVIIYRYLFDSLVDPELRQLEVTMREAIAAAYPNIDFMNLVQLQDKYHYHWSSARNNLEMAIDGIPNVYIPRSKAKDYFVCCDL